jgi:hypothetical protein
MKYPVHTSIILGKIEGLVWTVRVEKEKYTLCSTAYDPNIEKEFRDKFVPDADFAILHHSSTLREYGMISFQDDEVFSILFLIAEYVVVI